MRRRLPVLVAALLVPVCLLAAPKPEKGVAANTNRTITVIDFRAPQYDTNGVKTAMLTGSKAIIFPDRMMEISQLGLDLFRNTPTGTVADVRVTSPQCFYNPDKGYAVSEESIRIARDNMVITGSNYVINSKEMRMQINHNVKVVFMGMRGDSMDAFLKPSSNAPPKKPSNGGK